MNTQSKSIDKEVLEITPGEWFLSHSKVAISPTSKRPFKSIKNSKSIGGKIIANAFGGGAFVNEAAINEAEANAKAICKAINGTYGKGYNPAAMDEVVKALEESLTIIERLSDQYREVANKHSSYTNGEHNRLQTALNNAKL